MNSKGVIEYKVRKPNGHFVKNPAVLEKKCACGGILIRDEFGKIHCLTCGDLELKGKKLVSKEVDANEVSSNRL